MCSMGLTAVGSYNFIAEHLIAAYAVYTGRLPDQQDFLSQPASQEQTCILGWRTSCLQCSTAKPAVTSTEIVC